MQGIIHEKEEHSNAKTYAGLEKKKGKTHSEHRKPISKHHEIQMSSVLHHTGELMRADAEVAQGAKTTATAECEQGCSVPTGHNRPLHLKTKSLTHTHSRSSQLTYIEASHSGSLIAWHIQIYGSECRSNLALTQTPVTLYLETQFNSCASYTRTGY